ncbi:MAG: lyase family protein [Paracoccaceae bacterium]|nr:lyase family protein [Paracoccaceae bacterium]
MSTSPFESAIFSELFRDAEVGKLFTDSAEIRAMLLVEGALAKAQGALGFIPETAAAAINSAAMEVIIDPAGLAAQTGRSAVPVPALVAAFREAMQAPDHAKFIHFGATSQDIMETGQNLRLRQVINIFSQRLNTLVQSLGNLAKAHAETPIAARTYSQIATPTSFGAIVASWGNPHLRHIERLALVKENLLQVSLSGAAGTLSAMGPKGPEVRAELAAGLGLADPCGSWHSQRDSVAAFAAWMTLVAGNLGKMGEDLILLTQSGVNEVDLGLGGGSSTMPQKNNPVEPSVLVALANFVMAQNSAMQSATLHRQQRDGAAWMLEWMVLPQMCMALSRMVNVATNLAKTVSPNAHNMSVGIDDGLGLIFAESLSFCLAETMPRPDAQNEVKALCILAKQTQTSLQKLAAKKWPTLNLESAFDLQRQMGTAPSEALVFAQATRQTLQKNT